MKWQDNLIDFCIKYGFQIVGALIILAVGAFIAVWVGRTLDGWLVRRKLEPPIRLLLVRVLRLLIFAFAALAALDKFGVQVLPLIAGLGVLGVGVGLAAQGVLSNLVAGLTIIFTKPFKVGQYIELLGVHGEVVTIELFTTTLIHSDRSLVVIPNRRIVGEILHNYSTVRQLHLKVGVAYGADLRNVLAAVRGVLERNPRVLKDPSATMGVESLGDSRVQLCVEPWVAVSDYGPAQGELNQAIVEEFRRQGIEIPFPQREVRLLGGAAA